MTKEQALGYTERAEELTNRIFALIPEHPEILEFDGPWMLFNIPGFKCHDLSPSLAQADAALVFARERYQKSQEK